MTVDAPRASLDTAIRLALRFLERGRHRDGWWRDFDTLAGASSEWVTAYVATALAGSGRAEARAAARAAWRRLRARRWWSPGWGYNVRVPADADSTLWALHLAHRLGIARSLRVRRAHAFLLRHVRADGAVATYAEAGPIRAFTRLGGEVRFRGWCGPHECVTAAAATLPGFPARERVLDALRRAQLPDGSWRAYWWRDREYATALAAEALAGSGAPGDAARARRAAAWAADRLRAAGDDAPFALACALRAVLAGGGPGADGAAEAGLARLLTLQAPDGGWAASAALRIPPPDVTDPDACPRWVPGGRGGGSVQVDGARCFTTATVLEALCRGEARRG